MTFNEYNFKICQILLELSECERSVEITRRVILDSIEYDPFLLFRKLDQEKKNYISPQDIINYMSQKDINIFIEEAKFIILFYDIDQDGLLSFEEFINLIQSKNLKAINKKINYSKKNEISYNIEFSFIKLIEKEIKLVQKMMNYLSNINLSKFDLHEIYHEMKSLNINCITKESLKNFFEKNNISFLDSDLNFIINRLDMNKDGKIDFVEFHSFFGFPNCLYISPNSVCPFCGTKCCNECLSGTKGTIYQNMKEEYICSQNNVVHNYKNNFEEEKISKSLGLRLSPERKFAPFEVDINDILKNHEIINVKRNSNNSHNEIISKSLSLRDLPERKYAPIEVEINQIYNEDKSKEKITDKDIMNFNSYLKTLIDGETEIELYKVELALKQDFNCEDFFRLFEYEGKGLIFPEDLHFGLNLLNLKPNEQIINLLMKRFDLLKENRLNFGDFFDMVVSFQKSYRNLVEKRVPLSENPENILDILDNETISCFKVLMVSIIEFEYRINNLRKEINLEEDKIKELFDIIDENKKGFLIYDDFVKYLIKNVIDSNNNQLGIDLLFIRLDKGRKGKLFLDNFIDELNIVK